MMQLAVNLFMGLNRCYKTKQLLGFLAPLILGSQGAAKKNVKEEHTRSILFIESKTKSRQAVTNTSGSHAREGNNF
ncbi:hypothetical protein Sjap_026359 [Stephania japonica]|uniref:Uncharacterized protein n=1 Tax=Stephania japonica TaxID=461633 RepID=A0AAP0HEY9_9MAGN